jgi:uncharacterized membrane protein YphA (DoxX/SURF4 family)
LLIKNIITDTNLLVRIILSLAFLGHGLVSLGLSPSYSLHCNLVDGINFTNISTHKIVEFQGWFDILISLLLIIRFKLKIILYIILIYLSIVCISALILYWNTTGYVFGISECLRRFPWIFFSLYLLLDLKEIKKYHFIRIGLSFAFISHGFASLGFLGLNQGHIDLAIKVVSEENARFFVYCSGITDSIIGFMLLQGMYTRYVSIIGVIWISFIVYLSYLSAIPDAIFRTAFLIAAIYVFLDNRTYYPKLINYETN